MSCDSKVRKEKTEKRVASNWIANRKKIGLIKFGGWKRGSARASDQQEKSGKTADGVRGHSYSRLNQQSNKEAGLLTKRTAQIRWVVQFWEYGAIKQFDLKDEQLMQCFLLEIARKTIWSLPVRTSNSATKWWAWNGFGRATKFGAFKRNSNVNRCFE